MPEPFYSTALVRARTGLLLRYRALHAALCIVVALLVIPPGHAAVTEAWAQRYSGPSVAYAVAIDAAGNAFVTGFSADDIYGSDDIYTAKYSAADGALLWEKRYDGPAHGQDWGQALALDAHGDVIVTGFSGNLVTWFSGNGDNSDIYTAKYAGADGTLLWEQRHDSPGFHWDFGSDLVLTPDGDVVVTGSTPILGRYHFYTAKYAREDGALLWETLYGLPDTDSYASRIAVDRKGNIVVSGVSHNGIDWDIYTAKYKGSNGKLLWERRYDGPLGGNDLPAALTIDASGDVIVVVDVLGVLDYDYYTAKYAQKDGALLWEKIYNGPANGNDLAAAVAVDAAGNVIVTGASVGDHELFESYTAKYAARDGTLLWENRYRGSTNGGDAGMGLGIDQFGNVVVASTSVGIETGSDYHTAKYAASDGALLWEKRYNGPDDGDEYPAPGHCLAIGVNGSVAITGAGFITVLYRDDLVSPDPNRLPDRRRLERRQIGSADH